MLNVSWSGLQLQFLVGRSELAAALRRRLRRCMRSSPGLTCPASPQGPCKSNRLQLPLLPLHGLPCSFLCRSSRARLGFSGQHRPHGRGPLLERGFASRADWVQHLHKACLVLGCLSTAAGSCALLPPCWPGLCGSFQTKRRSAPGRHR